MNPPNKSNPYLPSPLASQPAPSPGASGEVREIVFTTLAEVERLEEQMVETFHGPDAEPSASQRVLASLRGMLEHRLSKAAAPMLPGGEALREALAKSLQSLESLQLLAEEKYQEEEAFYSTDYKEGVKDTCGVVQQALADVTRCKEAIKEARAALAQPTPPLPGGENLNNFKHALAKAVNELSVPNGSVRHQDGTLSSHDAYLRLYDALAPFIATPLPGGTLVDGKDGELWDHLDKLGVWNAPTDSKTWTIHQGGCPGTESTLRLSVRDVLKVLVENRAAMSAQADAGRDEQ